MIVQTIEISLSKGRAPDLLAHVAESGREIEMIPDVKLFADDYTAEIDTVKPDGTFTMTNCTINADGNIIAPITEQAVAVKGLCHYIIKIYNDDVVIYSACGSLWVDDHLITDDMIESIAEVNGYRFPQDFATLDDIPSADTFIDDNAVVNDKTWSSDKINDEMLHITPYHQYKTSEQVVGEWINGKPVYEKTYTLNINSSSVYVLDANINRDNAKLIPDSNYAILVPNPDIYYSTQLSQSAFLRIILNDTGLVVTLDGYYNSLGNTTVWVRVRYIKNSD